MLPLILSLYANMTLTALLVMGSAIVVCALCSVLVFHPNYDDSVIRRFGLALLAIGAYLRVAGIIENIERLDRPFSNVAILVWFGLALFLADHFFKFLRAAKGARERRRRSNDRKDGENGALKV